MGPRPNSIVIDKLDMERIYDWKFLNKVLHDMSFDDKWIDWNCSYVCGVRLAILINGSPTS